MNWTRSLKPTRKMMGLSLLIIGQVLAVSAIQDIIAQSLHILLSAESASVVMTAYMMTVMFGRLFFGRITDKVGEKKLLLWSLPIMAATLCGYPFADGTFALAVVRVLHGIAYALVVNSIFLVVRKSVSRKNQARASAFAGTCIYLGSGLAMAAGLWLAKMTILWQVVIVLGISSVVLVYSGLALISKPSVTLRQRAKKLIHAVHSACSVKGITQKDAFILALPGLGVVAAYSSFLAWFASYWLNQPGLILAMATVGNAAVALTVMPRFASSPKGYFPIMMGSNLIMILCLIMIWMGRSLPIMLLAGILMGIAICGNTLSITEAISRKVNPKKHGAAFATSGFMIQLGGVIGTFYSSVMWGYLGAAMWLTVIPLLLISLIPLLLVICKDKKERNDRKVILSKVAFKRKYVSLHAEFGHYESFTRSYEQLQKLLKRKGSGQLPTLDGMETERVAFFVVLMNACRALRLLEAVKQASTSLPVEGMIQKIQELLLRLLEEIESREMEYSYNIQMGYSVFWDSGSSSLEIQAALVERAKSAARRDAAKNANRNVLDLLRAVQVLGFVDLKEVFEIYEEEVSEHWLLT